MPGLQAGGFSPPPSNFKKPPLATLFFSASIKLPMYPQDGRGAAVQTPLLEDLAKISEISTLATAPYGTVSPLLETNMEVKTKFLSKINDRIKCNNIIYLQNIIMLKMFFLFFSRYNFSTFSGEKAVESDQGVAGIMGDMVSTLVRAGHRVHSVRVYTTLSQRAIYCETNTYTYYETSSILSETYCLSYVYIVLSIVFALSDRIVCWRLTVNIHFRKYFCLNIYQLFEKEDIVHRWVSTGLYIFGR